MHGFAAVCLPLAQMSIDPALLVIGGLIVMGFMLMRLQKRGNRSNASPAYRPSRPADKASASRAERTSIDNWEVQMHELARELTGRVDTKLAAMQQLLLMIDERIASLDEKLARLDAALAVLPEGHRQETPQVAGAKVSHEPASETAPAKPTTSQQSTAADSGQVG